MLVCRQSGSVFPTVLTGTKNLFCFSSDLHGMALFVCYGYFCLLWVFLFVMGVFVCYGCFFAVNMVMSG